MSLQPYYEDEWATIYHGDCREVLPTLPAKSAHLLLTDPPYGVNYVSNMGNGYHGSRPIEGDDGGLDVPAVLRSALRCLVHQRHFYVFGPFDLSDITTGTTTELIWDKGTVGMGNLSLPWKASHERVTFGVWSKFESERGCGALTARIRRSSVLRVPTTNNGHGAKYHPTEKPVLLLRQLIEASSLFGETVLDPFMGAGSTLLAARAEGRKAIGIEVDERYCETAAKRLGQLKLAL